MAQFDIYGIGNALVDTEIEVDDPFLANNGIEKGFMTLVDEPRQNTLLAALADHANDHRKACGGSAANTLIAAQYFGARTCYACKVADDEHGRFYLDNLRAAGVAHNYEGKALPHGTTGKCLVMITPDAERTMNTFLGISAEVGIEDICAETIANSRCVYLEGYLVTSDRARQATIAMRDIAKKNQVQTAMTFSDPAMAEFFSDGLREMIGDGIDLLFCNEEEARLFTKTNSLDDAVRELKKFAKRLAITCGAEGARLFDGQQEYRVAPHKVKAVDTNGAGDMFAGAFLYALGRGYSFVDAGKLASRASAEVVKDFGPRLEPARHAVLLQEVFGDVASGGTA